MDKELSDGEFVSCVEHVEILKSIVISRNLEGFRDAKGLRHLVQRWCPSLHTFFFSIGELTITLEGGVNNFLLLMFGDENPFDIFPARILKLKTNFLVTLKGVLLLLEGNRPKWASGL